MKSSTIKRYRRLLQHKIIIRALFRHIFITLFGAGSALAVAQDETKKPAYNVNGPVIFNPAFLHGDNIDVTRFSRGNPNPAGTFAVQVSVNGESRGRHNIVFAPVDGDISAQPCFTAKEITRFGIITQDNHHPQSSETEKCAQLQQWVADGQINYDSGSFHLDLLVPQAYLVHQPRGYTDPASWDAGVPAAFLDYSSNIYAQNSSGRYSEDNQNVSGNLGLLSGLNIMGWRVRNRINTYWNHGSSARTNNLYTYVRRDISALRSQLTLGDSVTSGDLFDSLNVRGIQLQSDERMLPEGLRYYTPVLRGVAETNAKVRVIQRNQTVYEVTVPPGPFELEDVPAMGYGGDLRMTITEADGRERTQLIPFSAPPMLLHEGVSRFGVTVGKLRDDSLKNNPGVAQGMYQYGLANMYTLYGGGQISENYSSLGIGQAFNTPLGGISVDATHARSVLKDRISSGNSFNVGYSRFLDTTSTDVTLAAWRYSSKGFYSLRDAALERYADDRDYYFVDYRTKQRLTFNVGQTLWNAGRLNFSGSFYHYWDTRSPTSQYMLSYNKSERYFSWGLALSRAFDADGHKIDSFTLSLSVPMGYASITEQPLFSSLYSTFTHDSEGGNSLQANAIGSQGDLGELTYGIGTALGRTEDHSTQAEFNGNINYSTQYGQFSSTASVGNHTRQFSVGANGSLVAHKGGLTLGPRLGDYPFAIVHADGAEGAKLTNGYGSRIDSRGYAIVPSLTPYRANAISVDATGMSDKVDILQNETTVIPRMGAAVAVEVKTLSGAPLMLIVRDRKGDFLPIGTEIFNDEGRSLGIVGQGGMAFIRGWQPEKKKLSVKDFLGGEMCSLPADKMIAKRLKEAAGKIIQAEVICH